MHSELSSFCTRIIFTRTSIVHRTFIAHSLVIFVSHLYKHICKQGSSAKAEAAGCAAACGVLRGPNLLQVQAPQHAILLHPGVAHAAGMLAAARIEAQLRAGSKNASRSLTQTSHVGTARKSRCRSSASMAMAAIEAGDRQEMVPEGLGALLCSLALAADGPFVRGRCWPALAAGLLSSRPATSRPPLRP